MSNPMEDTIDGEAQVPQSKQTVANGPPQVNGEEDSDLFGSDSEKGARM